MKVTSVEGNRQKLDGGAMFGHAPKAVWSKWLTPDDHNQIELACRCLLIEDNGQKILLETGIGAFFNPKMAKRYGVQDGGHHLIENLRKINVEPEDITDIILSHLHFDHAGGLLTPWDPEEKPRLIFPNAHYIIGQEAWNRACSPHSRDKASFIPGLTTQIEQTQKLQIIEKQGEWSKNPAFSFFFSHGHTVGQMHTILQAREQKYVFTGDLIPGTPWVHTPITMGYDRFPELLIEEKEKLYKQAVPEQWWLFFTHDPHVSHCQVSLDEEGRFRPQATQPQLNISTLSSTRLC